MVDAQHFTQLLIGMMNSENEIRSEAEKQYEKIALKDRGPLLFNHYLNPSADVESRSLSLVLLRRLLSLSYEEFFMETQIQKDQFHTEFIRCMNVETQPVLRKRLTDLLAELARNSIDDKSGKQTWAGVMQFLDMCATSDNAAFREAGMSLIESVPNVFGSDSFKYIAGIKTMFHSSLLYGADSSVRTAAVRAYVAFVCDNEENDAVIRQLSDLVPAVIKVCQHVVDTEDDDDVPLQCLGDLASTIPKILAPHMSEIFTLCAGTVANQEKDDSYRHSGLEVMVSICESSNIMRKKGAVYLPALIQQCLQLMTELDDDLQEWLDMDDAEDELEEETATIGETSLDRIACALGGKAVMNHALQCINELLNNENWKCRHAGLCALSTIGEGCKRQMEPLMPDIVNNFVLPKLSDPHPRVRYAVCNAIGQMCTDFQPTIQKKCHERIVPTLLDAMNDLNTPRVSAHAAAAMVNFCEDCPKAIISIYLPSIMERLESVLSQTFQQMLANGKKLVLEQTITTIASVADAAQDHFAKFYTNLMPPLKYIFENAKEDNLKLLRGKTIECISLIGVAQLGSQIREQRRPPNIDFAKYLDMIMPAVLSAAEFNPPLAVVNGEDAEDNDDWDYLPIDENRSLGIRTAGLEDKVTACEMIVCFARELKDSFAGYVERVMGLMLPLLPYLFHDGVRSAAAECLPCLMVCAKGYGDEYLRQMWTVIFSNYKGAIEKETDLEVLCEQLNGIAQCLEEFGGNNAIVTGADVETIFAIIHEQLQHFDKRRSEREKKEKDEEQDEEDQEKLDELVELETTVLARMSDLIHYLFMTKSEAVIPYFDQLVPKFAALLDPRRPFHDRQWGLCIFDDVIEFGGESSLRYQNIFFQPMVNALADKYPEVRQAAAYGCGIMGLKGSPSYAKHCAQFLQPLVSAIEKTNARSTEEDTRATENAISAVAKILKYNSSEINVNDVVPRFIGWLPIWNDEEEVPYVFDYFCDLVESQHDALRDDPSRVFQIILNAFSHGAFEDESGEEMRMVKTRMKGIMEHIRANEQLFTQIVQSLQLNSHQRSVLEQILA
uniref:TOG domain-containing protein n=1 Tax=Globodera rostochiensis TaxID=31243 RepID=A0A914HGN0_GLORO